MAYARQVYNIPYDSLNFIKQKNKHLLRTTGFYYQYYQIKNIMIFFFENFF